MGLLSKKKKNKVEEKTEEKPKASETIEELELRLSQMKQKKELPEIVETDEQQQEIPVANLFIYQIELFKRVEEINNTLKEILNAIKNA